jgi:hypothetical protein
VGTWYSNPVSGSGLVASGNGVVKYLRGSKASELDSKDLREEEREKKKPKMIAGSSGVHFKDFSGW